jgi:hypothetical protein
MCFNWMTFFQHFFRRSCFNFHLFWLFQTVCVWNMSQIRDRKPRLRFDVYLAQSSSPSITEKSPKFLTKHFAPVWNCRHIFPPPLPFLTGVDKPIETLTIRKHAHAVLSKVQHTHSLMPSSQQHIFLFLSSSLVFYKFFPPCACRMAVSARFCAFPPCLPPNPLQRIPHPPDSVCHHSSDRKETTMRVSLS